MRTVVNLGILRDNLKDKLSNKLFSWIDVRNNFYNFGLNILEDIFKFDNIGIFTNDLKDAIRIRNVNKNVPIVLTNFKNIDQIYDLVVNNITLVIKEYSQLEEIEALNLQDKLSLMIQININNFEDGIKCKNFTKTMEYIDSCNCFTVVGIFTVVNDTKNNDISGFKDIIFKSQLRSFVIGSSIDYVSDGFISKEIFNNAINYELNVDKCFKLSKGDLFISKKIKKDCYGIRIKADNINLSRIDKLFIDGEKYISVKTNYNTLFMIGKNMVKAGKKIDITSLIPNNCYTNWPVFYFLNGKNVKLIDFD